MGRSEADAIGTLRFSLGAQSTDNDVQKVLNVLPDVVKRAREVK
jgi:cysteine desulfurase